MDYDDLAFAPTIGTTNGQTIAPLIGHKPHPSKGTMRRDI